MKQFYFLTAQLTKRFSLTCLLVGAFGLFLTPVANANGNGDPVNGVGTETEETEDGTSSVTGPEETTGPNAFTVELGATSALDIVLNPGFTLPLVNCNGTGDGVIALLVTDAGLPATAPLDVSYTVDGGASVSAGNITPTAGVITLTGLLAGEYVVTVEGSTGCTADSDPITLEPSMDLLATAGPVTDVTDCLTGTNDGTVTIGLSNNTGLAALTGGDNFSVSSDLITGTLGSFALDVPALGGLTDQGTIDVTGLTAGTHDLTIVNDLTGCSVVLEDVVVGLPAVEVAVTSNADLACWDDGDGEIVLDVDVDGVASTGDVDITYDYTALVGGDTETVTLEDVTPTSGTVTIGSLSAGSYDITLTDVATGCVGDLTP